MCVKEVCAYLCERGLCACVCACVREKFMRGCVHVCVCVKEVHAYMCERFVCMCVREVHVWVRACVCVCKRSACIYV